MKPCVENRKPIALLAVNALEGPEASELRAHLELCSGCRKYLEEIALEKTRCQLQRKQRLEEVNRLPCIVGDGVGHAIHLGQLQLAAHGAHIGQLVRLMIFRSPDLLGGHA